MTGLEALALVKMLTQGHNKTGGPPLPFEDLARITLKLNAIVEMRGLKLPGEESFTEADRIWLLGDTVDAVMLHAREAGIDPVIAMNELKERHGDVPIVTALERRVDALLEAEGLPPTSLPSP